MSAAKPTSDEPVRYRRQTLVRVIGTILLTACALMVVLGMTVLADRLHGPQVILYWSWCFLLVLASIGVATADMIMVRRAGQRLRRELFQRQFMTGGFTTKPRENPSDNRARHQPPSG